MRSVVPLAVLACLALGACAHVRPADVRLPTAQLDTIKVPRLAGTASDAVVGFLAEAHGELRMRGAYQGVTVDGSSAELGDGYGQDVGRVARNTDWLAPEIYPGYWGDGRFGVANPIHQPGDLVRVAAREYSVVYVMGEVNKPATVLPMRNGSLTLSQAISDGGSFDSNTAAAKQLFVIRNSTLNTPDRIGLAAELITLLQGRGGAGS